MKTLLKKLIELQTVSSDVGANRKALLYCQGWLKKVGVNSRLINLSGKPVLIWGAPIKKTRFLFNTHIDVVPGSHHVFKPRMVKSRLFGRGSADTKSSVAVFLELSKNLFKTITEKRILFSIVCDEEIGGESTNQLISLLPKLEFAVFGEPTNLKVVNEAKGIMQIKITAKGTTAHGSKPWMGNNAIEKLSKLIGNFSKNHSQNKPTKETTYNLSLISGGSAINQVPDKCEAWIDARFNPDHNPSNILKIVKREFTGCNVEVIKSESCIQTSADNIFVKKFTHSIEQNKLPKKLKFDFGSSDARHCTKLGIPAIVFGPKGNNLHQEDEWIDIPSITKCKKVYEDFINSHL